MPEVAHRDGERELARMLGLRERGQRPHASKECERAFGDERAVVLAHRRIRAEEGAKLRVCRGVEHAHALDRGGERRDLVFPHAHGVCS